VGVTNIHSGSFSQMLCGPQKYFNRFETLGKTLCVYNGGISVQCKHANCTGDYVHSIIERS